MTDPITLSLDYAPNAVNEPRWGWGRPPHARLAALLAQRRDTYAGTLRTIAGYADDLRRIPVEVGDPFEPAWRNPFVPGLDGAALYAFMRERRPRRYVEIGSGNSTKFVSRAKRDGGLATHLTSIDPEPRAEIDELCDAVVRTPFEAADLAWVERLEPGDIVFVDGSHRVFMNDDTVVAVLELLPAIPPGVLVGIHDIFLPDDYPPDWADRFYSEQYLLAAWLLGGGGGLETVLPAYYASVLEPLAGEALEPLWSTPGFEAVERHGCAFWLEAPPRRTTRSRTCRSGFTRSTSAVAR
jgi:predicted O-methyltransferase YrrM